MCESTIKEWLRFGEIETGFESGLENLPVSGGFLTANTTTQATEGKTVPVKVILEYYFVGI